MLGTSATRGQLMVSPQLEEYVSSQLQKEGTFMKERRKLREERQLVRPKNKAYSKSEWKAWNKRPADAGGAPDASPASSSTPAKGGKGKDGKGKGEAGHE